jgi:oligopeptide/dipeptide ABC transporter ATP-binding protein
MGPLLEVEGLRTHFRTSSGVVRAVDGVSFTVEPGEVLGIVGESGSGKSVTALSLMGLIPHPQGFHPGGSVRLSGRELLGLSEAEFRRVRGSDIAMVFQDPMTSLNPVMPVGRQITEAIRAHQQVSRPEARARAVELLEAVGIPSPGQRVWNYPHQFSGGMRQRVMIAIALACRPKVLIADEPTTALDVTVQAQILDLLRSLQQRYRTALLLITHDLGVVARMADRVLVMYAGRVVEEGPAEDIFYDPLMPYTWALLRSIPRPDARMDTLPAIAGSAPSMGDPWRACAFRPRCQFAIEACADRPPALDDRGNGHRAACVHGLAEFRERRVRVARTPGEVGDHRAPA